MRIPVILAILILIFPPAYCQIRQADEETHNEGFDPSVNQLNWLYKFPGYNGAGITVSVKEQKVDSNDIDLRGRFLFSPLASNFITTHASQMATLIAGGGNSSDFSRGSAWKSTISSSSFFNLLPDPDNYFNGGGISIQNHSYGTGIESYYGPDSRLYDEQAYNNPWLLHIFSAGNLGDQLTPSGKYQDLLYSNLSGSFKMSKNSLSVGAVDASLTLSSKSSRGPANDGRIKPELVAYGLDGTSGAAAITSGIAAVMQQVFQNQHDSLPPSSLLKAILMNTAEDIGTPGPDYLSGYGNVQAIKSVRAIEDNQFYIINISGSQTLEVELPSKLRGETKIMLAWIDPPAPENNSKSLVHDFDLEIRDENGLDFLPWALSSFPHPDSLAKPAFRGKDTLNNQEQVAFNAVSGKYKAIIHAPAFNGVRQLALTWYTSSDSLGWSFPLEGDKLKAGQSHTLLFTSPLKVPGFIEFKSGDSWENLGELSAGSKRFNWITPAKAGAYQLRLVLPDTTMYSAKFTISGTPQLKVGYVCPDSTLIYWTGSTAKNFQLFSLKENYLDTMGVTNDTILAIRRADLYYAFAEKFEGLDGLRSITLLPSRQGVGCYVENFLADLLADDKARLSLRVGFLRDIKKIIFQKRINNSWINLWESDPALSLFYDDPDLQKGTNFYRVLIDLGYKQVFSDIASVFYFENQGVILYPNPLPRGQTLKIATRDTENLLIEFFDSMGRRLHSYGPVETIEQVPISPLRAGIYFYRISRNNARIGSGRIAIQ